MTKYNKCSNNNLFQHQMSICIHVSIDFSSFSQILTFDTEIADIRGQTLQAIKVISHAIRYLKDHLLKSMRTLTSITNDEILWVLTVPVVWENTSILFMRIAAQEVFLEHNTKEGKITLNKLAI